MTLIGFCIHDQGSIYSKENFITTEDLDQTKSSHGSN